MEPEVTIPDPMYCGACGKRVNDDRGNSLMALDFHVVNNIVDSEYEAFIKAQFGKFDPDKKYLLCFECYLSSLGFKPDETDTEKKQD